VSLTSKDVANFKRIFTNNFAYGDSAGLKSKFLKILPSKLVVVMLKKRVRSDYLLQRESIKFFQLSSIAYIEKKNARSNRLLLTALRLLGPSLPNSYTELLNCCVRITAKQPNQRDLCSGSVFDSTSALDVLTFDATGWYQLSRGLFSLGYFRSAWVARENSLELSISEGRKQIVYNTLTMRAIEAHLERRNFSLANELLDKFSSEMPPDSLNEVIDYVAMMQGSYIISEERKLCLSESEKLFGELISRQTAFVGAGSPSSNYGNEIDGSETIVRLRYVGRKYLPSENFHGSRCDISAYNVLNVLALICKNGTRGMFLDDLKMIIGRARESQELPDLQKIGEKPIVWINRKLPVYRSTAVSGIRVLFSILRFSPKHLKLFGFDFYSLPMMYDDNSLNFYRDGHGWQLADHFKPGTNPSAKGLVLAGTFSFHDPVSNFCVAQNLYKAGLFDIEPYGKSILELTPFQYVERLEEMQGDW